MLAVILGSLACLYLVSVICCFTIVGQCIHSTCAFEYDGFWKYAMFGKGEEVLPLFVGFSFFPIINTGLLLAWGMWAYRNKDTYKKYSTLGSS